MAVEFDCLRRRPPKHVAADDVGDDVDAGVDAAVDALVVVASVSPGTGAEGMVQFLQQLPLEMYEPVHPDDTRHTDAEILCRFQLRYTDDYQLQWR